MNWPLVRRDGIVGLVPPSPHFRTHAIHDRLAKLRAKYRRAATLVDQLEQAIFVDHFLPLDLLRRFSKWLNFWASGPESAARDAGYSIFCYLHEPNPLPPRFLDQHDRPTENEQSLMTDWITRLQKAWNHGTTIPPVDFESIPEG